MKKTKLEKHLEELGESTSGGAHDAVTFSGKGLSLLKNLFKSSKKDDDEYEDELEKDEMEDDEDEDEEEEDEKPQRRRKVKKSAANGGDLEEEDEDPEDPADEEDEIITNRNKRIKKDSLKNAVTKNAGRFDERRFEKSFDEFEEDHSDVLDASPALESLAKHVRVMAKNVNSTNAGVAELQNTVLVLAKGLEQSLRAQASLAADLELIKKQPVNAPNSGFVVMNKNAGAGNERRLSKSDIQDTLTDMMNSGEIEAHYLTKLGPVRGDVALKQFVDSLPANVRAKL